MDNVADLTAQPRPLRVRVDGEAREYPIHPLTIDDLGSLQGWVDAQFPDPFEVVREAIARGDYTVPQQQYLMDRAVAAATSGRRPIGTPEADRLLYSLEGTIQLLLLSIRKGRPDFAEEEARALRMHMTLADLYALRAYAGIEPVTSDPKGPPTTPAATGSSTSPRRRRRR